VRSTDGRLASLAKAIDTFVADNKDKNMRGFVVLLDSNDEANQKKLQEIAEAQKIAIPLTIALDGSKGPGSYKLHEKADVTALVTQSKKVTANFVLVNPAPADAEGQQAEVAPILEAAKKVLQ